jgi:hypothetical protein
MTYNEETNLLNNIEDIKEVIRSPTFKQLLKETHENNIMLKEIIKFINTYLSNHNNENDNDFFRNVLANLISNGINIKR